MTLTKEQAIAEHRKMWNWIADETEKRGWKVWKDAYFDEHGIDIKDRPSYCCYCCEYAKIEKHGLECKRCPIDWSPTITCGGGSLFAQWLQADDYRTAAELARKIAELPRSHGRAVKRQRSDQPERKETEA